MHRSSWKASGFSASSPIDFLMRQVSPGPDSPDRVALWSFCSFIFVLNIFAFVKLFANIHPWAVIMVNQVSTTFTIYWIAWKSQLLKIRSKRQDFPKDWDEPLGRSSEPLGSRSSSKESGISRAAESRTKSSKDALKQLKQLWCHQICLKLTKRIQFSADNYWSSLSNCSFGIISGAADKGQHCHFLRSAMLVLYVYTFYSATKEVEMRHFQCTELWKENTVKTSRKERVTQRKGKERQLIMRKVKKSTSETKDQ